MDSQNREGSRIPINRIAPPFVPFRRLAPRMYRGLGPRRYYIPALGFSSLALYPSGTSISGYSLRRSASLPLLRSNRASSTYQNRYGSPAATANTRESIVHHAIHGHLRGVRRVHSAWAWAIQHSQPAELPRQASHGLNKLVGEKGRGATRSCRPGWLHLMLESLPRAQHHVGLAGIQLAMLVATTVTSPASPFPIRGPGRPRARPSAGGRVLVRLLGIFSGTPLPVTIHAVQS